MHFYARYDVWVLRVSETSTCCTVLFRPTSVLTKIDRRRSIKIRRYFCGFVDLEVVGGDRRNGRVADEKASINVILNKLKNFHRRMCTSMAEVES